MPLTPEAKKLLAETIRGSAHDPEKGVRARLLRAIHDEADRRYRLSVPIDEAGLDEAHRRRRERIEAWIDERARATKPKNKTELKATKDRLLAQAEKEAGATLVNRLVLLRFLEALGLSKPAVLTGGWSSKGYREFREFAPTLCTNGTTDATEGYSILLQYLFDELAVDLPGLFGDVGLTRLFAIPAATLREVVERLDEPGLASAWTDDTTLGWVYQYWNDPDREALDAKINGGGKIEPHEIASKTQMFTERYMVEWLLQNSLGLTWFAICRKKGWTPEAESVFQVLEARREEWRRKRDANEVALDALMPIESDLEDRWKYYVPQAITNEAIANAPESVRAIRLLDPACGSGHFLVIAFDLLASMYREEGSHLGTTLSDKQIAESILDNNLHGIDIDPRAIQIAAAAVYLKAKALSKDARPRRVNLVAPVLQLGSLPESDSAVVQLRAELTSEVAIPEALTQRLLTSLAGVDYFGSLLKVDAAVDDAIRDVELEFERSHGQGDLFGGFPSEQVKLSPSEARGAVLNRLERFLAQHSKSEDLGLRLDGEQLAAGVRFVRMAKEGTYDVVVGNPPYHGTGKLRESGYYSSNYPEGRPDLFACFYLRGLELLRHSGYCAFITLSNWMTLGVYRDFRGVVRRNHLVSVADLGKAAFTTGGTLISTTCAVIQKASATCPSIALRPHAPAEVVRDDSQPSRTHAAVLLHRGRYDFAPQRFEVIEGEPIIYWWSEDYLKKYASVPKLGQLSPVRTGVCTSDNTRFLRKVWELCAKSICSSIRESGARSWAAYVTGAKGSAWFDEASDVCLWRANGLEMKTFNAALYGSYSRTVQNEAFYFRLGVAFSTIGAAFTARKHRVPSIFGKAGLSVFPDDRDHVVCLMNRTETRSVMAALNPTVNFLVGDVERIPVFPVAQASAVLVTLEQAFSERESHRETSVEFRSPGPCAWSYVQDWAQHAVDRPEGTPLPRYEPKYDAPTPESVVGFAVGVALGRFGADGEGILDTAPSSALPSGVLFLSSERVDSLDHPACEPILNAWKEHGDVVGDGDDQRTYLRKSFFDFHKKVYESRPIYFPLSSAKKNFAAFISIHRWANDTLNVFLADHLVPAKRRLDGELEDLRTAKASGTNRGRAEKRFTEVQKLLEELDDFIARVMETAEKGAPPPDEKTTKREVDARYVMDLDDGVMVNSAALWPLLEPQWKEPKKWWKELANAEGKKDYDWSHVAARHFPSRVRKKCHDEPSLAVAHRCFWELHPAKAHAWELRLQHEIRADFTIDEPGSDEARAKFVKEHDRESRDIFTKEMKRREKKDVQEDSDAGPLFEDAEAREAEEADA